MSESINKHMSNSSANPRHEADRPTGRRHLQARICRGQNAIHPHQHVHSARSALFVFAGVAVAAAALLAPVDARGGLATAGRLLVELDARDATAATAQWRNAGALGGAFERIGKPTVADVAGIRAVQFDGKADAFRGPQSVAEIEGDAPRSIEVWALRPSIDGLEQTIVAWGQRGQNGAGISLNWGTSPGFGGATHWAVDLGWNGPPRAGKWRYLVYTYDGNTVRLYDNTVEKAVREVKLATAPGMCIELAAQNDGEGKPCFPNAPNGTQAVSLCLAAVRIHSGALTPDQVKANFACDSRRFGAVVDDPFALAPPLSSDDLTVKLFAESQGIIALSPRGSAFDFTPGDRPRGPGSAGNYHLGDLTLRARVGSGSWQSYRSANAPAAILPIETRSGFAADLTPAMGSGCPLHVERRWRVVDGKLVLRFILTNKGKEAVEIGSLGAPMVFNNDFSNRSLKDTHEKCSFADPYIGGDAGYLQVTRLNSAGPVLIVYPEAGNQFEAYRHLRDDPLGRSVTFEGFYEWMAHSKAYAENEWAGKEQWNAATSRTLAPGAEAAYGFVFVTAPGSREIEATLLANKRPVAVAVPGTVLAMDQSNRLFVKHNQGLQSAVAEPAGAVTLTRDAAGTAHGWRGFTLAPVREGRARLVLTYQDGSRQFIHTYAVPSQQTQVTRLADFHEKHQWYTNAKDPFHRASSYMLYDREADKLLDQESRQFDVGESDEVGAGPNLLMAMKNNLMPEAVQVAHLEEYVDNVLWGNLQDKSSYGVKASLFYWNPTEFPGYYTVGGGWSWDKARGETTWRSYNYPHQAAIYWSLYQLARTTTGLVTKHTWDWYLTQAYKTALGMKKLGNYNGVGLMDGSVFLEILKSMQREGWTNQLVEYEGFFKGRAQKWSTEDYPFGSEMPWDSTGQEEVYQWCKYYGFPAKAQGSLDAIMAYTPTVPNWAYNGAARRYWDNATYGKFNEIFRQSGHYGSSLNAIPLLDAYRDNPSDFYLLRTGYGATMNILPNINAAGHGSMSFITDTAYMTYEPYTGDFGSAFFGYAYNAAAYAYHHAEFGWLGFGAEVRQSGNTLTITPKDAFRRRVYISTLGLWLTLEAGRFEQVTTDLAGDKVTVAIAAAEAHTSTARLIVEQPAGGRKPLVYRPTVTLPLVRGAWEVALGKQPVSVTLRR